MSIYFDFLLAFVEKRCKTIAFDLCASTEKCLVAAYLPMSMKNYVTREFSGSLL